MKLKTRKLSGILFCDFRIENRNRVRWTEYAFIENVNGRIIYVIRVKRGSKVNYPFKHPLIMNFCIKLNKV
jgi:hypothetical protein